MAFKDLVKSCDADSGLPRYLDGQSSIEVIDNAEYLKLSIPQIQEKLRLRHLVITGRPTETVDFDESGLQVLTNLDSKVQFQGGWHRVIDAHNSNGSSRPIDSHEG